MALNPAQQARLDEIEARFLRMEQEEEDIPDVAPEDRDVQTFPGWSGGVRASDYGGTAPQDLELPDGSS